jgi:AbrB family looped-hinge helix DNA binding protein
MTLAKIKKKSQITVPVAVMKEVGLELGDYLEFELKDGEIRLYPKKLVDSGIEFSIDGKRGLPGGHEMSS